MRCLRASSRPKNADDKPGKLSDEDAAYWRKHDLQELFATLQRELLDAKPAHPREFLILRLGIHTSERPCDALEADKLASPCSLGSLGGSSANDVPFSSGACEASSDSGGSPKDSSLEGDSMRRKSLLQHERSSVADSLHPMECVPVPKFMSMDRLLSFAEVAARDWHEEPMTQTVVHLVSHQWLGNKEADPEGAHLRCLQRIFGRMVQGYAEDLFEPGDWQPFLENRSADSAEAVRAAESKTARGSPCAGGTGSSLGRRSVKTEASLVEDIVNGLLWIDWCSIPQLTMRCDALTEGDAKMEETCKKKLAAINSIPAYVERCDYFWICTPTATHADTGVTCDFSSWRSRGWCRVEEWTNALANRRKMPLVITDSKKLATLGAIDFLLSQIGRPEKSVCNGDFTCCRMEHKMHADMMMHIIPCDKHCVTATMVKLYEAKLSKLRRTEQKLMYCLYLCLQGTVYSGSYCEASRDVFQSIEDYLGRICYRNLDDLNELEDNPLHWATFLADPDLIAQIVATRPALLGGRNKVGWSTLAMGAYRPDGQLDKILEAVPGFRDLEILNSCSNNGLTAMHRAARGGFPANLEALLRCRAEVDPVRRDNLYTPLLSASRSGYAECCRILLRYRARVDARGSGDVTALHVALEATSLEGSSEPDAKTQVLSVLIEARAHIGARCSRGRSPLDVAKAAGVHRLPDICI